MELPATAAARERSPRGPAVLRVSAASGVLLSMAPLVGSPATFWTCGVPMGVTDRKKKHRRPSSRAYLIGKPAAGWRSVFWAFPALGVPRTNRPRSGDSGAGIGVHRGAGSPRFFEGTSKAKRQRSHCWALGARSRVESARRFLGPEGVRKPRDTAGAWTCSTRGMS